VRAAGGQVLDLVQCLAFDDAEPDTAAVQDEASPVLNDDQWRRLSAYGVKQQVPAGAVLFDVGEHTYDLIAVESGGIDIVRTERAGSPLAVVAHHGPRSFVGELNLLTGQVTWLSARASEAGLLHRVSPESFRRLMDEDPELSDLILRALIARRRALRDGLAASSVEILGSELSAPALALQTYVARHQLAHSWVDFDSPAGTALARAASVTAPDAQGRARALRDPVRLDPAQGSPTRNGPPGTSHCTNRIR
jgi:thioredoxin reductase (NADPH)